MLIRKFFSHLFVSSLCCEGNISNSRFSSSRFYSDKMNAICRHSSVYPVHRQSVPDNKVSWDIPWSDYSPPQFSASYLATSDWADPDIKDEKFNPKWNAEDNGIDRQSYGPSGKIPYKVVDGVPLNPRGRTGLSGRGRLGRWGPNHAADAIVTRWKRTNGTKAINPETKNSTLQFIAILRKDCQKWAIPGGFVDPKEASSAAVLRELFEEAINTDTLSPEVQSSIKKFFKDGKMVYKGYVDDPRNVDNAWIETTAINFHDDEGKETENITLEARDDAADAKWIDIEENMDIYPPHYEIISHLRTLHNV